MDKKISIAIIGLGARGRHYARCCKEFSAEIEIVAAADPIPERVEQMRAEFNLPAERCFASGEALLKEERLADAVFICTQDREHFELRSFHRTGSIQSREKTGFTYRDHANHSDHHYALYFQIFQGKL